MVCFSAVKAKVGACAVCLLMMVGFTGAVQAQSIAFVDARRLIEQAPQGKVEDAKLQEAFGDRTRRLKGRVELFRSQKEEFEKNRVLMGADEVESKTRELRNFQRELEREQREYNEDLSHAQNEMLAKLQNMISQVIIDIAKERGIDLVLQNVVYASEKVNLTDDVLKALEAKK